MGCGAGKGEKKQSIKSLHFDRTGVSSLDEFLGRINELIEGYAGFVDPLDDLEWRFKQTSGFWWVRNAHLREALIGVFLCVGSAVNGELGVLEIKLEERKPFISGKFKSRAGEQIDESLEHFARLADDLEDLVEKKIPEILENVLKLVGDVERVS